MSEQFRRTPVTPVPRAEGMTEEHMLHEQASDYARELADLAVSSDPEVVRAAIPQLVGSLKKELVFLNLTDRQAAQSMLDRLIDLQLDPQIASGEANLSVPEPIAVAVDALNAWISKTDVSQAT